MSKKRKVVVSVAALLLSETAACTPIGELLSGTPTPPPICDPVPPPPGWENTPTPTVTPTRTPAPTGSPSATPTPVPQAQAPRHSIGMPGKSPAPAPSPSSATGYERGLPLRERLRLRIVRLAGDEHIHGVEANFPLTEVAWVASGGELEARQDGIRWLPPRRGGDFVITAIVDAGPLGVAVDSLVVEMSS